MSSLLLGDENVAAHGDHMELCSRQVHSGSYNCFPPKQHRRHIALVSISIFTRNLYDKQAFAVGQGYPSIRLCQVIGCTDDAILLSSM